MFELALLSLAKRLLSALSSILVAYVCSRKMHQLWRYVVEAPSRQACRTRRACCWRSSYLNSYFNCKLEISWSLSQSRTRSPYKCQCTRLKDSGGQNHYKAITQTSWFFLKPVVRGCRCLEGHDSMCICLLRQLHYCGFQATLCATTAI